MKVSVIAQVDGVNSHALHLAQLVKRLPSHDIECVIRPSKMFTAGVPEEVMKCVQPGGNDCEIELVVGQPRICPTPGKKTIYLAAWESTILPKECVENLNKAALVIAPSNFCAQVFSSCGVLRPISVVPLGVSESFAYTPMVDITPGTMDFICVGNQRNGPNRKGLTRVVEHFRTAFPNGEKVRLTVKVNPGQDVELADKRIFMCSKFFQEREWAERLSKCHALIHYGIGAFELVPLEAMALGRPVIAPRWGGHADYFNSNVGLELSHRLVPAADSWRGFGHWAQPNDDSAIAALRWAYHSRDYMERLGIDAAKAVRGYTWENHVNRIAEAIHSLVAPPVIQKAAPVKAAKNRFVMLRRYGDIMALLPLLHRISKENGEPTELVVHKDFADILDGVSYVKPIIWKGGMEGALAAARRHDAVCLHATGEGISFDRENDHFAKTPWKKLGYEWDKYAPPVFDKRDFAREAKLAEKVFKTDNLKVLVNFQSVSSPFPREPWELIVEKLRRHFQDVEFIDIASVRAERIYDLLGLMDRAACLITVDTSTLWLAGASTVPVIQLVNDTPCFASPPRGNVVGRFKYSDVAGASAAIVSIVKRALEPNRAENVACVAREYEATNEQTRAREARAEETWPMDVPRHHYYGIGHRNSSSLGDERGLPYVRDMIHATLDGPTDIVLIHNNDIAFDPQLIEAVKESCRKYGCYWAYRVQQKGSLPDGGCDLFAFTRKWWSLHEYQFPDFLLGCRWWDNVLRRLMRWSGCPEGERLYYHEPHGDNAESTVRKKSPAENHNVKLAYQWMARWDEPLADDGELYPKPIVWVYAICWNENPMIEFFLRHYSTFADKIIIYDEQSTDGTREIIARFRKAELREWPHKGLDDMMFVEAVNSFPKEAIGKANYVIWADIDELLYHPDPLRALAQANGGVIASKGYALIGERPDGTQPDLWEIAKTSHQLYDLIRSGVRQPNYDKQIIWAPHVQMTHTVGRHTYSQWPRHRGQVATNVEFKLLHCHYVGGVVATMERNGRNLARCIEKKFGWNYEASEDKPEQVGTVSWVREAIEKNKLIEVMP